MGKYGPLGLILFFLLSFFVSFGIFRSYDLRATIELQKIIPDSFTTFFSLFSIIGHAEIAGIILLLILFALPNLNKIIIITLFVVSGIIELLGKAFISQKGPPLELVKTNLHLNLPVSSIPKEFFSYPSGHSDRTAFISGILLIAIWKGSLKKEYKLFFAFLIVTFDFLMFLSRVYLGEHWVTDVLGGLILGYTLAFIVPLFNFRYKKNRLI